MKVVQMLRDTLGKHVGAILAFVSLFLGIVNCYDNRRNSEDLRQFSAQRAASEDAPFLFMSRDPEILEQSAEFATVEHVSRDTLGAHPILKMRLHLRNEGTRTAKLVGMVATDTLSDLAIVRNALQDGGWRSRFLRQQSDGFLGPSNMAPGDTLSVDFRHEVVFVGEQRPFCLHVLILYESPTGYLYDTYLWLYYKQAPLPRIASRDLIIDRDWTGSPSRMTLPFTQDQLSRSYVLQSKRTEVEIVAPKLTEELKRWLDSKRRA